MHQWDVMFFAGLLMLTSYLAGRLAHRMQIPRIIGYLAVGLLFGTIVHQILPNNVAKEKLSFITDITLAIIAFVIGGTLQWRKLKRLGKQILVLLFTQGFLAFFFVFVVIIFIYPFFSTGENSFLHYYMPLGLAVGAISIATAPAAILQLIKEFRSQGPMTTILLGIVALDDALTVIVFAFAMPLVLVLTQNSSFEFSLVFEVFIEIGMAIILGLVAAIILYQLAKYLKERYEVFVVVLGIVLILVGISQFLNSSSLLANMVFGFLSINFLINPHKIFNEVEQIEEVLFGIFFALAGAHVDFSVLIQAGMLGLLITLARFIGKLCGCYVGAYWSGASANVRKYLGLALLPSAGVTIGLVLQAASHFGTSELTKVLVNGVIASVILNELLSPFLVKYALIQSGEGSIK